MCEECMCDTKKQKESIFNVDWPYGHVTDKGEDAKYLGTLKGSSNSFAFMVKGRVIILASYGNGALIKNKPAPEKYIRLYRAKAPFTYNSFEEAILDDACAPAGCTIHTAVKFP